MLATLEVDLLRPEVLTAALQEAIVRLDRPAGDVEADRERLREIITRLQAELTRLTEALVSGGNLPSIVAAITEREAQRSRAQQEFAALDQVEQAHGFDLRRAEQDLRAKLADWRGLLSRNVAQARQALRSLVPERLTFTPKNEGESASTCSRGWPYLTASSRESPYLKRWWPQGDSIPFGMSKYTESLGWPDASFSLTAL